LKKSAAKLGVFSKHIARSQGHGEIAVQRQSLIQGFHGARLRTEDAINIELIPIYSS